MIINSKSSSNEQINISGRTVIGVNKDASITHDIEADSKRDLVTPAADEVVKPMEIIQEEILRKSSTLKHS